MAQVIQWKQEKEKFIFSSFDFSDDLLSAYAKFKVMIHMYSTTVVAIATAINTYTVPWSYFKVAHSLRAGISIPSVSTGRCNEAAAGPTGTEL